MITIIDYGMGNLRSLVNAFEFLGEKVCLTGGAKEIVKAEKIVFPGVGNFGKATSNLKRKKIDLAIKKGIKKGIPFLGICLGLQLLFEESEEAPKTKGLSIFKGRVFKFQKVKIPQIGWNQINILRKSKIFEGIEDRSFVYFMHSFYVKSLDKKIVVAKTDYGIDFCSAIESKNIFGLQFHPEKSGIIGLKILENLIKLKC